MLRKLRILSIALCTTHAVAGQSAYVNTQQGIYQLTGGAGNCSRIAITNPCGFDNSILSIAVYKDTVYYTTWSGGLKRFKIGVSGSCETLIPAGESYNALTVDRNGILYLANQNLAKYDPYTRELTQLGTMPFVSMGDLAFYKDKLLLAGFDPFDWSTGLYEINVNDLSASELFMSTPSFFGLVSYPVACGNSRYFGLSSNNASSTQLMELDLAHKSVLGNSCTLPLDILDAASSTETGLDSKVAITELKISKTCQSTFGSIQLKAIYPGNNDLTYTLDNNISNTTGVFNNVNDGQHSIKVVAAGNVCFADTTFSIEAYYKPAARVIKTNPDHCANISGSIKFNCTSPNGPFIYTLLNTGVSEPTGEFTNLRGGQYNFRIEGSNGCALDTSIALAENILMGGCNDVFIPNAFTPNADGKNDFFNVNLPSSFKNVSIQVYSRWGNVIFQAKGNSISWDGTSKATQQPVGSYIYMMSFTDPSGVQKTMKGTITLIR